MVVYDSVGCLIVLFMGLLCCYALPPAEYQTVNQNVMNDMKKPSPLSYDAEAALIQRPVIGILAQASDPLRPEGDSYIYAAYVKAVEMAGALVVPVKINQSEEYYKDLFNKLNGVIYPGGAVSIVASGYEKAAQYFFNYSKQVYDDSGDHFPILGICLGFQQLTDLVVGGDILSHCKGQDLSLALNFTHDARESRFLENLPDDLYQTLSQWEVTYNNHQYCMSTKTFYANSKLSKFYKVISTNYGSVGLPFISTIEAHKYPIYGVQWHPEKNIYLWDSPHVNHSAHAVRVTQYVFNFFINEARKSKHQYPSLEELSKALIFNYQPQYKGLPSLHNVYLFDSQVVTSDIFDMWDWPKFSAIQDARFYQMVNFVFFLLLLFAVLATIRVISHYHANSYRVFYARKHHDKPDLFS